MRITNINGTGENSCNCYSWLDHWKRYNTKGHKVPSYCVVNTCYSKPEVGGHVQKDSYYDKSWYIAPLCKGCNAKTGESLNISDSTSFASANVNETCG